MHVCVCVALQDVKRALIAMLQVYTHCLYSTVWYTISVCVCVCVCEFFRCSVVFFSLPVSSCFHCLFLQPEWAVPSPVPLSHDNYQGYFVWTQKLCDFVMGCMARNICISIYICIYILKSKGRRTIAMVAILFIVVQGAITTKAIMWRFCIQDCIMLLDSWFCVSHVRLRLWIKCRAL